MATIQVVLDDGLLELTDKLAKQRNVNRSALIREALRSYLKLLRYRELERQERSAYENQPDDLDEVRRWEEVADWPDESSAVRSASIRSRGPTRRGPSWS